MDAPETLRRITYDATIDEAVVVSLRLANRTQAFRSQIRQTIIIAGVISGLVFFAAVYYLTSSAASDVTVAAAGGAVFGAAFAYFFRRFFNTEIRRQHRKVIAEQFAGKAVIASELELRSDGVRARQAGVEMIFAWTQCIGIQDNPDDIELNFSPGICVVRNRYFSSPAARQDFRDTAQRLWRQPDAAARPD
jgi:hypothetical protein